MYPQGAGTDRALATGLTSRSVAGLNLATGDLTQLPDDS